MSGLASFAATERREEPAFAGFLGASLLSATGSLPLHMAPLFVMALIADGRVSVTEAGWVASIRAFGELFAALLLPTIGMQQIPRIWIFIASICLLVAFLVGSSSVFIVILAGFFVVGLCSGILKYAGTISASAHPNRTFAFIFRLALVLSLTGAVLCLLLLTRSFASYEILLQRLAFVLAPVLLCGSLLYCPPRHPIECKSRCAAGGGVFGLFVVFFFFVGVSGFLAYVGQQSLSRGIPLHELILAFSTVKILAGLSLLIGTHVFPSSSQHQITGREVGVVLLSLWAVWFSSVALAFVAGFFLLEVSLNRLSARLQATVVEVSPQLSVKWLNGIILVGSAAGPLINGLAISVGSETGFMILTSLAVCCPMLLRRKARSTAAQFA